MEVTVQPSQIGGTLEAPASKSSMQRACAAALLNVGETVIYNPGTSNDDRAALDVIQKLGAEITWNQNGSITVRSSGVKPISNEIDCGESGLGIRMFTPIAALSDQEITIKGSGSLVSRPMDFFDTIFPQLNIAIQSNEGKLPLVIKGPLKPEDIEVDGSLSSQFLTGLLMAYGAANAMGVSISVRDLKSRPYIDLTLEVMAQFGVRVENKNYHNFYFPGKPIQSNLVQPVEYAVEGDWSGAAFLLVAGAVAGDVSLTGLDPASAQADKSVLEALVNSGAKISVSPARIQVGQALLKSFHFNATDCPDLFPPLVALAAFCNGKTTIEGVSRLAHKESNRALTLQEEFGKMGVRIDLIDDLMIIHGGGNVKGAVVHSRHDHRIAMACAVAALRASGPTTIQKADAIHKSYPGFYEDLLALKAQVSVDHGEKIG
jgi:3-phosphoshikimate 1-carboxyvinyltransferase